MSAASINLCDSNPCPFLWKPICGTDGQTYNSLCQMKATNYCRGTNVGIAFEGECKPGCNDACILVHDPVCGSDGKVYSNSCFLEVKNKCDGTNISIVPCA